MTYNELVDKIKKELSKYDASAVSEHLAIQFNIFGEGEGAFYVEFTDGHINVEPYEYFDRDILISTTYDIALKIAAREIDIQEEAYAGRLFAAAISDAGLRRGNPAALPGGAGYGGKPPAVHLQRGHLRSAPAGGPLHHAKDAGDVPPPSSRGSVAHRTAGVETAAEKMQPHQPGGSGAGPGAAG